MYFVTICVEDRQPALANEAAFNAFKAAIAKLQHWRGLAAMLMPRSFACNRGTNTKSRSEIGKFFRSVEALDAPAATCLMELAAWLFRTTSAFRRIVA
jgi:hypothetical protein